MRPHHAPALALFALGCGSTTPADTDLVTVSGVSQSEPEINRVEPSYGSNGGGAFVEVFGNRLPDQPDLLIGGQLAEVTDATPDRIQAFVPANEKTDWVQVKVVGADGTEVKQNKAYQYWPDGSGLTGLWGEAYRLDYLGTYWTNQGGGTGPYTPPSQAQIRMVWLQPSELTYDAIWAPYTDWCQVDYDAGLSATTIATNMEGFTLSDDDGDAVQLEPSPSDTNYFEKLGMQANQLAPGTTFSLESGAANGTWPAFGVPDLVRMPSRPELLSPLMDAATPGTTTDTIELQWTPDGDSSYMVAILSRTSANGAVIEERATCLLADDGQHTVDPLVWSGWTPGEFVLIQVGRVIADGRRLPHNEADSQLVGVYWVYGAAQAL